MYSTVLGTVDVKDAFLMHGGPREAYGGKSTQQAVSSEAQPSRSTLGSQNVVLEFQEIPHRRTGNGMVR